MSRSGGKSGKGVGGSIGRVSTCVCVCLEKTAKVTGRLVTLWKIIPADFHVRRIIPKEAHSDAAGENFIR